MSLPLAGGAADDAEQVEIITLSVKGVEFCLDIRSVREIRGWTPATVVPHAPDFIRGVINLRGVVMPVVDVSARLGLGPSEPSNRHVIIVAQSGDGVTGLLVDSVQETLHLSASQMQPPPDTWGGSGRVVDAIVPLEGRMISRLIVEQLVGGEDLLAA